MKEITNRSGKVLARLQDVSPYRKEIRDLGGAVLGWYAPHRDMTFDRSGRVVSNSGDTRASLIPPSE